MITVDPQVFEVLHLALRKRLPLVPPDVSLAHLQTVLDMGAGLQPWGKALFQLLVEQASRELVDQVRIEGIDSHGPRFGNRSL